jgi:hypothetical protein
LLLKTLLLDGCEGVDDLALIHLTDEFHAGEPESPMMRDHIAEALIFKARGKGQSVGGGALGLETLSLSECRKVTD